MKDARTMRKTAHSPVASYLHSMIFLGIVVAVSAAGYSAQHLSTAGEDLVDSHGQAIPLYLSVTIMDWLLVFFVWRGICCRGVTCKTLIQGRWTNTREVLRDLGLAAAFWDILLLVVWGLEKIPVPEGTKSLDTLMP